MAPRWLRLDAVLAIHARQISEHGGGQGVRDRALLESALGRPQHLHAYSKPEPDMAVLAAAVLFGIVGNHPFVDGNKRTGYVAARTFLLLNGVDVEATATDKYTMVIGVADGSWSEAEVVAWMRQRQKPLDPSG